MGMPMRSLSARLKFLRFFWRNDRGNFAIIFGLVAIPLLGIIGLGVDVTRAYIAQVRLQGAVDNAALAAATLDGQSEEVIKDKTTKYFYSNYHADFWAPPATPNVEIDNGLVQVSATATMNNYFLVLFGHDTFTIATAAEATGQAHGLEVVLVLDITGSMKNAVSATDPTVKLTAMKKAAVDLVDILFGDATINDKLKVGLVPFAASVRLDPATAVTNGWIDTQGLSTYARQNFDNNQYAYLIYSGGGGPDQLTNVPWQGCVEARPNGLEETDTPPTAGDPKSRWVPFFSPDNPDDLFQVDMATTGNLTSLSGEKTIDGRGTNRSIVLVKDQLLLTQNGIYQTASGAWTRVTGYNTAPGLNQAAVWVKFGTVNRNTQWNQTVSVTLLGISLVTFTKQTLMTKSFQNTYLTDNTYGSTSQHQTSAAKYAGKSPSSGVGTTVNGPGRMCVASPITPMQSDKSKIVTAINNLQADGYTHVQLGVAWGWRLISPGEPYTDGHAYDDDEWEKAIIILTDGDNTMPTESNASINGSEYTAYGYAAQARLGAGIDTASEVEDEQNNILTRTCNNIKAVKKPDGSSAIHVYTIAFGSEVSASGIQALLEGCATSPDDYFYAPSSDKLKTVFSSIANDLSQIRLTK